MKEYDLFVPLCYNNGRQIEPAKFQDLQKRLLDHFGGPLLVGEAGPPPRRPRHRGLPFLGACGAPEECGGSIFAHALTFFPQPNEGFWTMAGITYRDEIVIYRVISSNAREARRFLTHLKKQLKEQFEQEEILMVERDVQTL